MNETQASPLTVSETGVSTMTLASMGLLSVESI